MLQFSSFRFGSLEVFGGGLQRGQETFCEESGSSEGFWMLFGVFEVGRIGLLNLFDGGCCLGVLVFWFFVADCKEVRSPLYISITGQAFARRVVQG